MKTTGPEPQPCNPCGEKVIRQTPTPPEWKQKPDAAKGIEIGPGARLRTNIPENNKGFP